MRSTSSCPDLSAAERGRLELVAGEGLEVGEELLGCPGGEDVLDLIGVDPPGVCDRLDDVRPGLAWVVVDLEGDGRDVAVRGGDLDAEQQAVADAFALAR